ncbi:MAG: hypothetical protein QM608_04135 [Caulobacter sp.]
MGLIISGGSPSTTSPSKGSIFKQRYITGFSDWIRREGCTHALTLTPDVRCDASFDPERELKKPLRTLSKIIAHDLRGIPWRKTGSPWAKDETVWMAGFVERFDKYGNRYPHFHAAVRLHPGEERTFKRLLASRWGYGEQVPALKPVFHRPGSYPSYDLKPLTDVDGWSRYTTKQVSPDDAILWTHSELLRWS